MFFHGYASLMPGMDSAYPAPIEWGHLSAQLEILNHLTGLRAMVTRLTLQLTPRGPRKSMISEASLASLRLFDVLRLRAQRRNQGTAYPVYPASSF